MKAIFKRAILLHIICSVLIIFLLVAVPILCLLSHQRTTGGTVNSKQIEITSRPTQPLPYNPEEALRCLQEFRNFLHHLINLLICPPCDNILK